MQKLINIISSIHLFVSKQFERVESDKPRLILKSILFVIVFYFFYSYLGVFKYLHLRPSSMHISAQCQRASVALNYYKTDMNFFKPRIHQHIKGEGITGVEFPFVYYIGAVLYKIFGFDEMYLRLLSLIIVTFGLFLFYLFIDIWLKNSLLSVMITVTGCLSPVFLFYMPNFLPDAPALALQLGSWYFLMRYIKTNRLYHVNLFATLGGLAILIKSVSIMGFMVVLCLLLLDKWKFFSTKESPGNYFLNKSIIIKRISVAVGVALLWYIYASWLTAHYELQSFVLRPLIVSDYEQALEIFKNIKDIWLNYYFAYEGYVLISFAALLFFTLIKFADRILAAITIIYFLGISCYVYLFFYQFRWHDYYLIAMLPGVFFLLLTMGEMALRFSNKYFKPIHVILIIVLFFNMKESLIYCKKIYTERNSKDIYYWTGDFRAYEDLEPKLRSLGVKRSDIVLSAVDDSYSASLYLMDQPGVCLSNEMGHDSISDYIDNKAVKYLIVNDSAKFNEYYPNNFAKNIIGYHRGLIVYKLRN